LGLGYSPILRKEIAIGFILLYLFFEIYVLLVESVQKVFKFSFGFIGPTEIRILGIFFSLYAYFSPLRRHNTLFLIFLAVMALRLVYNVVKKAIELNKRRSRFGKA